MLNEFCQGLRDGFLLCAKLPNPTGTLQQHIMNGYIPRHVLLYASWFRDFVFMVSLVVMTVVSYIVACFLLWREL